MELNYQKRFQEMQQSTRRNQIEEIQKSFELSARNTRKEAQETSTLPELLICWRCDKVGHKKKECTAILFCTNCSRNNQTTSRCRQTFKENCVHCKINDHTKEYCPANRLDSFKQNKGISGPLWRTTQIATSSWSVKDRIIQNYSTKPISVEPKGD